MDEPSVKKVVEEERKRFHVWNINPIYINNQHASLKNERTEGNRHNRMVDDEMNSLWVNYEEKYEDEIDCKVKVELNPRGENVGEKKSEQNQGKNPYTHFVSIPLLDKNFQQTIQILH